jgi:hypothetical protein
MQNTTLHLLESEHYPAGIIEASATNAALLSNRIDITQMNIYIYASEVL